MCAREPCLLHHGKGRRIAVRSCLLLPPRGMPPLWSSPALPLSGYCVCVAMLPSAQVDWEVKKDKRPDSNLELMLQIMYYNMPGPKGEG